MERLRIEWVKVEERLVKTLIQVAGSSGSARGNGVGLTPEQTTDIIKQYRSEQMAKSTQAEIVDSPN